MTDNMDQRLEKLEGGFEKLEGDFGRVVVILEGEQIRDIYGNVTGREGGMVAQGERHTEGLNVMSHQLDNILAKLPRRWTVTQRISASMVVVIFVVGMAPVLAWAL